MDRYCYTMQDITTLTGVKRSTLYKWREWGLLPAPVGGKRYARYDDAYLRLVERIKRELVDQRITYKEFAERLAYERRRA